MTTKTVPASLNNPYIAMRETSGASKSSAGTGVGMFPDPDLTVDREWEK